MNPDEIKLDNLNKSFEYARFCNELESVENIETLKNIAKCYFKLYLKQQEVVINLMLPQS
jgi:hypothetical protein